MYKVLIVDDEIFDLEGMRSFIPWADLGMEVAASVNNGFDAIRVLEKKPIDIIVTDVHMPGMSGLELVRKSLEMDRRVKVIFVSGYQDFNYVKQAISLHAYSYVLKPMDDEELISALQKIKVELDGERQRKENERVYRQIVKNEYILQLLEGVSTDDIPGVLLAHYGLDQVVWPARAAALEINDLGWKLDPLPEHLKQEWFNRFYESVLPLFTEARITHVCKTSNQRIFLLAEYGVQMEELASLIQRIHELHPFTVTIGLGSEANNIYALRQSYGNALNALECKLLLGKGKVIVHEDALQYSEAEQLISTDFPLDGLFTAVLNYDLVAISDEVDRLFTVIAGLRSKYKIQLFVLRVLTGLDGHLKNINEQLVSSIQSIEIAKPDILLQYDTIDDIRSWLRYRLFAASEIIQSKKQKKSAKLVEEMIRYVKKQLHDNVTLKEVADHLSFSPNYLGSLFKEVTGTNFSEYVITLRMERAGELLKDPRVKIYEVADRVGYRYMPYFSRQFKEVFGMTPGEFRRKL